jgi:phosphoribosylamine---glycine ligase
MRVLVLGSGAREHAIAARLAADAEAGELICAPGNPGMAAVARTIPADLADPGGLVELARRERIDFTIVGPELPLSLGVADTFSAHGLLLLGPSRAAARLESSKAFAKAFLARHQVPTARFHTTESIDNAVAIVRSSEFGFPVVLKADGLAAGKGVVIAEDLPTAEAAITAAMQERRFGSAGERLVIEECLSGPELSFFVLSDGHRALSLASAQDHKRAFDDDRGPNTGGMGAFAPSVLLDTNLESRIVSEIVEPVVNGMEAEGQQFQGFLYVGLMLTEEGPKVIEFNVRFGDPEAQVVFPLIDEPLLPLLINAAEGRLRSQTCRLSNDKLVGVVVASRGYPESSESGQPIEGVVAAERISHVTVLHAGTARRDGVLVTAGGRVLTVVGRGPTFEQAIARAYEGVSQIHFNGMQYRHDIGRKALAQVVNRQSAIANQQ